MRPIAVCTIHESCSTGASGVNARVWISPPVLGATAAIIVESIRLGLMRSRSRIWPASAFHPSIRAHFNSSFLLDLPCIKRMLN